MMLRDVLAKPQVYILFARLIGATYGRRIYIERHIKPRKGDRILDIGCGPADILDSLPQVDYHGFDLSEEYIASARQRFGSRGHFHVEKVNIDLLKKYAGFDLVLATGVLHHLNDAEATDLFRVAKAALKPTGRLITLDGCFAEGQSRVARHLLSRDRGKYVRNQAGYVELAKTVFGNVRPFLTTELLRIPYTHIILECWS
jgi:SAM-dependent methyltransferase